MVRAEERSENAAAGERGGEILGGRGNLGL